MLAFYRFHKVNKKKLITFYRKRNFEKYTIKHGFHFMQPVACVYVPCFFFYWKRLETKGSVCGRHLLRNTQHESRLINIEALLGKLTKLI
jgi:hypothetical protein